MELAYKERCIPSSYSTIKKHKALRRRLEQAKSVSQFLLIKILHRLNGVVTQA
jgi:hypothetical protein